MYNVLVCDDEKDIVSALQIYLICKIWLPQKVSYGKFRGIIL